MLGAHTNSGNECNHCILQTHTSNNFIKNLKNNKIYYDIETSFHILGTIYAANSVGM